MDVLSSRVLHRTPNLARSRRFYRDVLGLAICREFGDPSDPCLVFFIGAGLLEIGSGRPNAASSG
jgi:catechol 2,3-dioxygenase-like lactoylglutathione lyase family enzyme